jgi:hypothetical protein
MIYKCENCYLEFDYPSLLKKHQNRKTSCITEKEYNDKIKIIMDGMNTKIQKSLEIKNKCLLCENNFLNKSNLKKHLNSVCPEKKNIRKNYTKYRK